MPRFDQLLVLDLDETLVYAADSEDEVGRPAEASVAGYALYRRPHVEEFLATALAWFEVGIWTASSAGYADAVVRFLGVRDRVRFLWARDRCTRWFDSETMDRVTLKPLKKLLRAHPFPKERILFVDDTPEKIRRSYGNYIRVQPFEGDPADDELPALLRYLETLGPEDDVRRVEKRGWRSRFR